MKTSDIKNDTRTEIAKRVNELFHKGASSCGSAAIANPVQIHRNAVQEGEKTSYLFALGGCQFPSGLLDSLPAYACWRRLAKRLDEGQYYDGVILTGDQIYTDVTAGLFDPTQLDDTYRRSYERWLHVEAVREVLSNVPLVPMLDDHEIHDNWEPLPDYHPELKTREQGLLELGIKEYRKYQRNSGPFPDDSCGKLPERQLWCSLTHYGLPVFLADTRTERGHRNVQNIHKAGIMSPGQFKALKDWLIKTDSNLPKIVITPSILLPRHSRVASRHRTADPDMEIPVTNALLSDSWDGYPYSMNSLLAHIVDKQIPNVLFVSGDEHIGCVARADIQDHEGNNPPVVIHSIHTSALYAPYPFANAIEQDLMGKEQYIFSTGNIKQSYQCKVESAFFPGEGFTILDLSVKDKGKWQLCCEFERAQSEDSKIYTTTLS